MDGINHIWGLYSISKKSEILWKYCFIYSPSTLFEEQVGDCHRWRIQWEKARNGELSTGLTDTSIAIDVLVEPRALRFHYDVYFSVPNIWRHWLLLVQVLFSTAFQVLFIRRYLHCEAVTALCWHASSGRWNTRLWWRKTFQKGTQSLRWQCHYKGLNSRSFNPQQCGKVISKCLKFRDLSPF